MENKRRNRRDRRSSGDGFFSKLFTRTAGNPADIEDQDWYLDSPDVRLTRIFSVVLVLHIIAVGGILAFKMIDKAAGPGSVPLAKSRVSPSQAAPAQVEYAGRAPAPKVAPTPAPITTAEPRSRDDRYCVIPGDTLSEIAGKLGVTVSDLKSTNHIVSADEIIPGMWLKIPVPVVLNPTDASDYDEAMDQSIDAAVPEEVVINSSSESGGAVYQVQQGDTAWRISQKFGINPNDLLRYNGVARPELLQVGQLLKIPGN